MNLMRSGDLIVTEGLAGKRGLHQQEHVLFQNALPHISYVRAHFLLSDLCARA
jgi:hypothetical protein